MAGSIIVGQGGKGTAGGVTPAVGVNGSVAPTSSIEIGFIDSFGNEQGVSATNPLPVTGTVTASNPSVGLTGATAPTSATEIGVIDISGKLQGASASNPVRTDPTGTTLQPVSGTITANQGTSPWIVAGGGYGRYRGNRCCDCSGHRGYDAAFGDLDIFLTAAYYR